MHRYSNVHEGRFCGTGTLVCHISCYIGRHGAPPHALFHLASFNATLYPKTFCAIAFINHLNYVIYRADNTYGAVKF